MAATEPEASGLIQAWVCHARPDGVFLREVMVPPGTTLAGAIARSGLTQEMPEVDPNVLRTGVFGKLRPLDTLVQPGDRIEVYRPLTADPKQARRKRVQSVRESGAREGQKWRRSGG
jgi:putative ubiquitin-RnfH superfamily antitoxin RatB of RatAB toxin-antitoxin module